MCVAFGCDQLCRLLSDGKKLRSAAETFFEEMDGALSSCQDDQYPTEIQSSIKRVRHVCRAFCALLSPCLSSEEIITCVSDIRFYKSEGFYAGLADEMVRTAGSMKTLMPTVRSFTLLAQSDEYGADDLKMIVQELPNLRDNLRAGALDALEAVLLEILKAESKKVLNNEDEHRVSPSQVATLLRGLELFQSKDSEVPALMASVEKWKHSSKSSLVVADFAEAVEACANQAVADLDLRRVASALQQIQNTKVPSNFPSRSLQSSMQALLPRALQNFKHRVGKPCQIYFWESS